MTKTLFNPKNGQEFSSELTEPQVIEKLKELEDNSFAQSLIHKSSWSMAQEFWAYKLAEDGGKKDEEGIPLKEGFYNLLIELFERSKLKYPKLMFGKKDKIYRGNKGLYVKVDGEYVGKITETDHFYPRNARPETIEVVKKISTDPIKFAVLYGKETGRCSFCGRELTVEESINRSYGPICADRYGLPYDHPVVEEEEFWG